MLCQDIMKRDVRCVTAETSVAEAAAVMRDEGIGFLHSASTYSGAVLASYSLTNELFLAGRAEYIASSGSDSPGTPNLLYGAGSNAWSLTFTPTGPT